MPCDETLGRIARIAYAKASGDHEASLEAVAKAIAEECAAIARERNTKSELITETYNSGFNEGFGAAARAIEKAIRERANGETQ